MEEKRKGRCNTLGERERQGAEGIGCVLVKDALERGCRNWRSQLYRDCMVTLGLGGWKSSLKPGGQ